MVQEIEIEFKNLLTKNEFELLMKEFNVTPKDFISQENYYFDTVNFSLRDKHSALRIRKKQDKYILTLKQPHEQGLLETHQELTEAQAFSLLNSEVTKMVDGTVKEAIATLGITPDELYYLGALKTDRIEIIDNDNILVLDHSFYLEHEDYELEYEVKDPVTGKEKFLKILKQNNIPLRTTKNKIQRFFELKGKKED
ncbi:adenylate cyclase [Schinkia azotoformans MEV2011]|uniref:Adenylate cyclase n=2 Tax=Schinkia azotoformans TaxID=1454 RepID=K6DRJ4_SCHAZ|nr:CYTH domain-containing protein [Schinkia azotoformans]EKN63401.1 adenylate cyclase [Schinkia azotoformans LMG 9581]KEF38358.1 adenylate cyclase [Schinkia azotoformans MEV2011]MEC1638700.1 CYTH domain-containing protein [Schinkia azotoformans]MEC1694101.1 CYTH domain-containing protein [Schinkia azotoformans]MEC1719241.1 CYTH domain-containing protein [Schinkia azotoformans]